MSFLAENCTCGQNLLQLVARGNSTIAELLRLSDYIPKEFRLETKADIQRFGDVVLDFTYFKSPEILDSKIENADNLRERDEELAESHGGIICRIYSAFEGVHRYVSDLKAFLEELIDGIYLQISLETIFCDEDGRQLMCEALYLYGAMLLMADSLFPGGVRERIIVSFHRHATQKRSFNSSIEEVSKLMRSTGYNSVHPGTKRPPNYPEEFFRRIELPKAYIELVIGHLRSDDIYHQIRAFPSPEHRSTALATQASMLFVCLYFAPSILHTHGSRMREIVDKFFSDNWVVSFYMGRIVNLAEAWEPYKAAKDALNNILEEANIREHSSNMAKKVQILLEKTEMLLADGYLSENKVLEQSTRILNVLRECNVALRWIILHTSGMDRTKGEMNKKCALLINLVVSEGKFTRTDIFNLLLSTAILELSLSKALNKLLENKSSKWSHYRDGASEHVLELAEAFAGYRPLARVAKNEKLNQWFKDIGQQIKLVNLNESEISERKIIQIIQAMKEVKDFHGLEASAGVIQAVNDVIINLQAMVKVARISDDSLVSLALISDFSYAWIVIDDYTSVMQTAIKTDPSKVGLLRATFLKITSALELPLLRINQAKSSDLISVSSYYSKQLVNYIRKVLQVIPKAMFFLLKEISHLQSSLKAIPSRLDKDKIKEFAQLDERYKMAELTQRVALLAEGVSMMESTLVGVVQIDPKQLLEEGIRRELVSRVAQALNDGLQFNPKEKGGELLKRLLLIGQQMRAFCLSFEYIQDYINMFCLKIWQEEVARIVNYNVQQECNELLKKKTSDFESEYQNSAIPIPKFAPTDSCSTNFVGRLLREMLRISNPKQTVFVPQLEKWYDVKTQSEVLAGSIFKEIKDSIGVAGIIGIDKLLAFLIVKDLQDIFYHLENFCKVENNMACVQSLQNCFTNAVAGAILIQNVSNSAQRNAKFCKDVLTLILRVGQMQIFRLLLKAELYSSCHLQAKNFSNALCTLSGSLMHDIRKNYDDPSVDNNENSATTELMKFLDWSLMTEPFDKIYVTFKSNQHLAILLALNALSASNKYRFAVDIGNRTGDTVDGECAVAGIATLLRQCHGDYLCRFLEFLSLYATSNLSVQQNRNGEPATETAVVVTLMKKVISKMSLPESLLTKYLSHHVIHSF